MILIQKIIQGFVIIFMGNSQKFVEIRKDTIAKRDQNLEIYGKIFAQILQKSNITPAKVEKIIDSNLTELVAMLNSGKTTSTELIAVFGSRAATIGRRMCIITEGNFEYALQKARECDEIRSKTGKQNCGLDEQFDESKNLPWLFGIPISVKDNHNIKGMRTTLGVTAKANNIKDTDCCIISCAKNSGMIPFIKTNLPQMIITYDTFNLIWGRTINPWNPNKSAGGSSGGQGSAIASKISPIGVGNDMFGSVRIPAAFNGVCGLLVSAYKLPLMNATSQVTRGFFGMDTIKLVTGPIGKSIDDLALWLSTMSYQQFYQNTQDAYINLQPFNYKIYHSISTKKLRIGYFQSFDLIQPSPAHIRAVRETVAFLQSQGHELIQITIPNSQELIMTPFVELGAEGYMQSFEVMLEGQEMIHEHSTFKKLSSMNGTLYGAMKWLVKMLQPRVGLVLEAATRLSLHQYLESVGRIYEMREEWIRYWRSNKLDFVVSPGLGFQATDHGFANDGSLLCLAYVALWNILAMPCCTLPVTVTREDELNYVSKWDDDFTNAIKKTVSTSQGMPVSMHIVGMPFTQESILGLAKTIENHYQFGKKHPLPRIDI